MSVPAELVGRTKLCSVGCWVIRCRDRWWSLWQSIGKPLSWGFHRTAVTVHTHTHTHTSVRSLWPHTNTPCSILTEKSWWIPAGRHCTARPLLPEKGKLTGITRAEGWSCTGLFSLITFSAPPSPSHSWSFKKDRLVFVVNISYIQVLKSALMRKHNHLWFTCLVNLIHYFDFVRKVLNTQGCLW